MPEPASASPQAERWISVARLLRPQGRHGELLAEPHTDLLDVFAKGNAFRLSAEEDSVPSAPSVNLQDCWQPQGRNAGRLVLKLEGVDSISGAEALEGKQLFLLETALPALSADTFLVRDLVGCSLFDGEQCLGTVIELEFPTGPDGRTRLPEAADLLVVEPAHAVPGAEPVLVPFVKLWLDHVDLAGRRISMHLPAGLFE